MSKLDKSKDNRVEHSENIWDKLITEVLVCFGIFIDNKDLQELNMYAMDVVEEKLKLFKFNSSNEKQCENIWSISVTFEVSKLIRSIDIKEEALSNIDLIFITLDVLK